MSQYNFGTGQLVAMPVGGGAPLRIGALQDVSVEFSGDTKSLFGQYQFAIDTARGKTKIEGKIGTANIDVAAYNQLFFGQTLSPTTEKRAVASEIGVIPTTPFTVTAANGATFFLDTGVYDVLTGLPMKQVASAPTTGQYSVNQTTGVYTFAAADTGKSVILSYLYTASTANSGTLTITNQLMGSSPKFQLVASQLYNGKVFTMILYSCIADKLSMPLKQDDFTISEIGYSAHANSANQVGLISTTSAVGGGS